jgi:uncharacterized damage-inducible protein DinB
MDVPHRFIEESRELLSRSYLPRVERCIERLTDDDVWWRANEESNSVGNLMLHLDGNVRQWIVGGLGGSTDARRRQEEFDAPERLTREVLLHRLRGTVHDADHVLARLEPKRLMERHQVQGHECDGLYIIYHVVEHFAMHTGQIIVLTKQRVGDLHFYDATSHSFRETWRKHGLSD